MALIDNLVSYWKLDEASGTRNDAHSTNNLASNGTGGVASATGIINNGADFEKGDSDYLSITNASQTGLNITGDISFSLWAKLEAFTGAETSFAMITKYLPTGNNRQYRIDIYEPAGAPGAGKVELDFSSDGTSALGALVQYRTTNNDITATATWFHIVGTFNIGTETAKIYVNGSSKSVTQTYGTTIGATLYSGTGDFNIGARSSTTEFFDGVIDEVGIWSRELTSSEVTQLYNGGAGLAYPFSSSTNSRFLMFM